MEICENNVSSGFVETNSVEQRRNIQNGTTDGCDVELKDLNSKNGF